MWTVTIKGLLAHKIRLVMTGVAVIIGVAFMSGSLILTDTIGKTFNDLFANIYSHTDAVVRAKAVFDSGRPGGGRGGGGGLGTGNRGRVDEATLARVRAVPGVRVADGTVQGVAQIVDKQKNQAVGGGGGRRGAPSLGLAWIPDHDLSEFHLVQGRAPTAADDVVIDKHTADTVHAVPGTTRVTVLTKTGLAGYRVSGIMKFGDQDSPLGASIVGFRPDTAARVLGQPGQFDSIVVGGKPGVSQTQLARRIRAAVAPPGANVEVLTGAEIVRESQDDLKSALSFFTTFLLVFAGIALFVGSFIIFNTFSILVAQRTREMALLRAIGAKSRQVLVAVVAEATLTGLVASIIGLGVGIILASGLKALLGAIGLNLPSGGTVFKARTAIVALIVGTVITTLAAIVPAWKASRVPPIAALRDVSIDHSGQSRGRVGSGFVVIGLGVVALVGGISGSTIQLVGLGAVLTFIGVAILGPVIARPISRVIGIPIRRTRGMSGSLATQNAMRNPKRTSATAAALMIGVGLVALIMVLAASTKASFSAVLDRVVKADYIVDAGGFRSTGFTADAVAKVQAVPGVAANGVAAAQQGQIKLDDSVESVSGYNLAALPQVLNIGVEQGSLDAIGADGLAVQVDTAKDHHWVLGTRVNAEFADASHTTFVVRAIYKEDTPVGDYLIGAATFRQHFPDAFIRTVYVKTDAPPGPELHAQIRAAFAGFPGTSVKSKAQFTKEETSRLDPLLKLIYVLLALSIVIAVFGIYNTLGLSVFERTRELGLLRAVGMSRGQMRAMVRWESVIVALLGAFLGLVIGLGFSWIMVTALAGDGLGRLVFPIGQLVVVVVLAGLCGLVAALLPAARAGRIDVLDAIASE